MMTRLDDFLSNHNIDSNTCMQKAVCHAIRMSDYHTSVGTAGQIESMISAVSEYVQTFKRLEINFHDFFYQKLDCGLYARWNSD